MDLSSPDVYYALLSPDTPTDVLENIGRALEKAKDRDVPDAPFLWRLLALNPAIPKAIIPTVARKAPKDFLRNPTGALALIDRRSQDACANINAASGLGVHAEGSRNELAHCTFTVTLRVPLASPTNLRLSGLPHR